MFNLEKNGYNKQEVDAYIKKLVMEHDKEVLSYKEKYLALQKNNKEDEPNFSATLVDAMEKARQIEMSWKNIYKLKIQQLDLLYTRFQSLFNEALEKYPQLENVGNIKSVIEEFKTAVGLALQDDFNAQLTSPVQTDNDTIRRLLSKMTAYGKEQESTKVVKLRRRRNLGAKRDIYFEEKSQIKPISNLEPEDASQNLVDKFLQEDSSDTIYTKFLSKQQKNDLSPNESGFDLKEAVNPTEDLEEIMKAFNFYPGATEN